MILKRWETNKVSPTIVPAYSPEKVFSQGTEEGIQKNDSLSELRRQNCDPGEYNMARYCRQSTRDKGPAQRENSRNVQRVLLKYSAKYWWALACNEMPETEGKKHLKGLEGTIPLDRVENLRKHGAFITVLTKILSQGKEKFIPDSMLLCCSLTKLKSKIQRIKLFSK